MSAVSPSSAPAEQAQRLGLFRASWLVAEREISTQVRTKSFVISLAVIIALILGAAGAFAIFGGGDGDSDDHRIAVIEDQPALADQISATPGLAVEPVQSESEAEELLLEEEADAFVTTTPNTPTGTTLMVLDSPAPEILEALSVTPEVVFLEPSSTQDAVLEAIVPLIFSLLFFIMVIGTATMTMQNTVQEKQSRIVEILLATVPSRALLLGKVLGNSVLAIGQAVLLGAAGLAGLMIAGQQEIIDMASVPMLWFLLFFVPGVVFFTALFAASASLVSRQEELGSVQFPAMTMLMAPYFVVILFAQNDLVMAIASYVPFAAPIAMPVRMFFGDTLWFEPVVSFALLVASVVIVALIASRIYSRSLLKTGDRVKLSEALSSEPAP